METRTEQRIFYFISLVILSAIALEPNQDSKQPSMEDEAQNVTISSKSMNAKNLIFSTRNTSSYQADPNSNYYGQYEEEVYTDEQGDQELIAEVEDDSSADEDDTDEEDLDGRSAYINNQFIPDEQPQLDTSPPLYELLQQQMQHVLVSTGPEFAIYSINDKEFKPKDKQESGGQMPPLKPLFSYGNDNSNDYGEDTEAEMEQEQEQEQEPEKNPNKPIEKQEEDNSQANQLNPTQELPKPMNTQSAKPITTSTTELTPLAVEVKPLHVSKPPSLHHPSAINSVHSSNGTVHKHKRRITFKTISTASHFVSTPLADLMFKFSIGMAKPSHPEPSKTNTNLEKCSDAATSSYKETSSTTTSTASVDNSKQTEESSPPVTSPVQPIVSGNGTYIHISNRPDPPRAPVVSAHLSGYTHHVNIPKRTRRPATQSQKKVVKVRKTKPRM